MRSTSCGENPGTEREGQPGAERHPDQPVEAEQDSATQRAQATDPAEQEDRLHDVPDLVAVAALCRPAARAGGGSRSVARTRGTHPKRWTAFR
jgi:hypothetical protein